MKKIVIFFVTSLLLAIGILLIMTSFRTRKEYQNTVDRNIKNIKGIKNVILIIACSLRADHLGCYQYERDTSPNIDQLAQGGILFKECFAQAPFTHHSVPSIMTSQYPRKLFGVNSGDAAIPDQANTFAELFKEEEFYTMGFMASPWTSEAFNFHQGFDCFFDASELLTLYKTGRGRRKNRVWGDELTKRIIDELKGIKSKFFLQIIYTDIHAPYTSFPPFKGKYMLNKQKEVGVDRYDETILHFDSYVGKLVEALKDMNILNNTLIIITSDHGEGFVKYHKYDRYHASLLYNTVIKIPLIFYSPKLYTKGIKIDNYVTSMDILPTTLDLMGIQYDRDRFDGISQKKVFETLGSSDNSKRLIVSETNFQYREKGMKRTCAIWDQRWKLIHNKERRIPYLREKLPIYELYDLQNDPNEITNLYNQEKHMAEKLISLLVDWEKENTFTLRKDKTHKKLLIEDIDPKIKDQLKALGYIQ